MQAKQTFFKTFNHKLITKGDPIKQDQWSYALAFNIDCSILLARCSYSIRVFEDNNGILEEFQVLNEHTGYVKKISSFRVTQQNQELICCQTIQELYSHVYNLSISESQTQLISCNGDSTLFIEEQQQKQNTWHVIQKLKITQLGYRVSFINEGIFTFQPKASEYLEIFQIKKMESLLSPKKLQLKEVIHIADFSFLSNLLFKNPFLLAKMVLT